MKNFIFIVCLFVLCTNAITYNGTLLWQYTHDTAIYESCAVSDLVNSVAGAGYNAKTQADLEAAVLESDGTPFLVYEHEDIEVGATPALTKTVAIGYRASSYTSEILLWNSLTDYEPDQTFTVPIEACPADGGEGKHAIDISDTGIIATAITVFPDAYSENARAYWWLDGDLDATPMMHESENETYARDVQLSIDGQVLAYIAGSRLVVIETLDGYVRVDEDFGFTSDALCMSGDGTYIGYGFQTFYLLKWNEDTLVYDNVWESTYTGLYVAGCAIAGDSSKMAVSYYTISYNRNTFKVWDVPGGDVFPIWSYTTAKDTADGQDVAWYVEMSRDGNVFAVASWGDEEGTVPQIQLFTTDADVTAPFFTQTTPGSMFCLALSQNSDTGVVYVVAGGKHVHANVMGAGGDLFAIRADPVA